MEAPPSPPQFLTTLATQILMCFGLYISLNLGDSSQNYHHLTTKSRPFYYFITVHGGFRPPLHQTLLLQQMENVVNHYDAQFVLTIGQLGLQDPLLQNGTRSFPNLRIPWYATKASEDHQSGRFSKQIKFPTGRSLEIIVLDTDISKENGLDPARINQFEHLKETLRASDSDWRFVIGLNPLEGCKESNDPESIERVHERLHVMFSRYHVNAYLSGNGCNGYVEIGGVAYMSHSSPTDKESYRSSREGNDGFFLHRVGLLEIETYHINVDGKVVRKTVLHQRGHEAM